jgi:hypothetical protein
VTNGLDLVTPSVTTKEAVMAAQLLTVSSALNSLAVMRTDTVYVTRTGPVKTVESISVNATPSVVDVADPMPVTVRPVLSMQSVILTDSVSARIIGKAQTALHM